MQIARTLRTIVFRAFHCVRESAAASSDNGLDHAWRRAICWREFRRIEDCETSTGSRSNVENAPAMLDCAGHRVNGARNRGHRRGHGFRHGCILAVNRAQNAESRFGVDPARTRISLFRGSLCWHFLVAPASCRRI
jgi:hypothetical protein